MTLKTIPQAFYRESQSLKTISCACDMSYCLFLVKKMMTLPGGRVETDSRERAGGKWRDSFYAMILVMLRQYGFVKTH